MLLIGDRAAKELDDLRRGERVENIDLGARKERRNHLERRILRCRANKSDVAGFDIGEEGVLLRLVEAMHFVDKDDGALASARFVLGRGHDVLDFLDAGEDGAEPHEFPTREASDETREGGFAAARRAPEEHGVKVVVFDLHAKRLSRTEKLFLADELVERARAHALRERLMRCRRGVVEGWLRQFGEEAHGFVLPGGDASEFLWRAAS